MEDTSDIKSEKNTQTEKKKRARQKNSKLN